MWKGQKHSDRRHQGQRAGDTTSRSEATTMTIREGWSDTAETKYPFSRRLLLLCGGHEDLCEGGGCLSGTLTVVHGACECCQVEVVEKYRVSVMAE
jgi:hypothetical protein